MKIPLAVLLLTLCAGAQTIATGVTGIRAVQSNGQTFVTWTDAGGLNGLASGGVYRYNLYRATAGACPVTDANLGSATLVEAKIMNNSGQINPDSNFSPTWRISTGTNQAMVTVPGDGTPLSSGSGLAVYTNLGPATACYAVVTCDATTSGSGCSGSVYTQSPITGGQSSMSGTVSESVGSITPLLTIDGNTANGIPGDQQFRLTPQRISRKPGANTVGKAMWVILHGAGG